MSLTRKYPRAYWFAVGWLLSSALGTVGLLWRHHQGRVKFQGLDY